MLGHSDVGNYYSVLFAMVQHHNYSITELENMMPFELEFFVVQVINFVQEQEAMAQQQMLDGE